MSFTVLGVRADGTFVRLAGQVEEYGPMGDLRGTSPHPDGFNLVALAADGGFFAREQVAFHRISKFDKTLSPLWSIEFDALHGVYPAVITATDDGGLAIAGDRVSSPEPELRVIRLGNGGELRWQGDISAEDLSDAQGAVVSSIVARPGAEIVLAGSTVNSTPAYTRGWLRAYHDEGAVLSTVSSCNDLELSALAVSPGETLVAGFRYQDGVPAAGLFASYPW